MRLGSLWPSTVPGRERLGTAALLVAAALAGYLITCVAYPAPLLSRDQELSRVLGLPIEAAERELTQQGFKVRQEGDEPDPVVPAGRVVWQDPPPETVLPGGSLVRLTASSGPAAVTVPDVVQFDLEQARRVLAAAGLKVGSVDTVTSSTEAGVIVTTRPGSGTPRPPGSTVDLLVSKGPAEIRVPNVVGLRQDEARDRLAGAGLRVGVLTTRPARRGAATGIVLEQRPGPGALSPREGRINLVISN